MSNTSSGSVRAALYGPVSTSKGRQDLDGQLEDLRREAARRGWIVAAEFSDETSGTKFDKIDRPGLDKMLDGVRAGEFDAILILRLDRLGRSLKHLVELAELFRERDVALVSIAGGATDTTTPMGRAFLQLMSVLAEFEAAITKERILEGVARAKRTGKTRTGKWFGRPKKDVDVEKALELRESGKSWRDIAQVLGIKVRTLRRRLEAGVAKPLQETG